MRSAKKVFWGLFFIAAAGLAVIRLFSWFPDIHFLNLTLSVIMVPIIITSLISRNFAGVFFPLGFAAVLLSDQIHTWWGFSVDFWPAMLVALLLSIGFHLLFRGNHHWQPDKWKNQNWNVKWNDDSRAHLEDSHTSEDVSDENIACGVSFTGSSKYLHSDALRHANLECSFGSLKVYFDGVTLHPDGAMAQVDCSFAQIELYIPRGWRVVNNLTSSFGSAKEKTRNDPGDGPVLTLTGGVSFGAVEIYYT